MLNNHPLASETPSEWKNIPIPVQNAFTNLIQTFYMSDEAVFDFEMQTNSRLYKLQEQVTKMKSEAKKESLKMKDEIYDKFAVLEQSINHRFDDVTKE